MFVCFLFFFFFERERERGEIYRAMDNGVVIHVKQSGNIVRQISLAQKGNVALGFSAISVYSMSIPYYDMRGI